jgi:hypothetical protein
MRAIALCLTLAATQALAQPRFDVRPLPGAYAVPVLDYPQFQQPSALSSVDASAAYVVGRQTIVGNFELIWNLDADISVPPWPAMYAPQWFSQSSGVAVLGLMNPIDGQVSGPYVMWKDGQLQSLPGPSGFQPQQLSSDGQTLFGRSESGAATIVRDEEVTELPASTPDSRYYWDSMSSDGSTVLGRSYFPSSQTIALVLWTADDQLIDLPRIFDSVLAPIISSDGNYVVGQGVSGSDVFLFAWSRELGYYRILPVPKHQNSNEPQYYNIWPTLILKGGSLITFNFDAASRLYFGILPSPLYGNSLPEFGPCGTFNCGRDFQDYVFYNPNQLPPLNVDWLSFYLISFDESRSLMLGGAYGLAYGSIGVNTHLVIKYPRCPADVDYNDFVDSDDFVLYVDLFARGCERVGVGALRVDPECVGSADYDHSGFVDSDDFIKFVEDFSTPCD